MRKPKPVDPLALPLDPAVLVSTAARGQRWPDGRVAMWREFRRGPDGIVIPVKRLARLSGISSTTLDHFERADFVPQLRTGLLIARALGVSPWRVLDYWNARRAYDRIHGLEPGHRARRTRYHASPAASAGSPLRTPDTEPSDPSPRGES